ncbi:MAG: glycosyltransferase family 39 protein [Archangium sp.]|nr:glycosyltransferase family 39 protein [Archangium sp.]
MKRVLGSWLLLALILIIDARLRLAHLFALARTPLFNTLGGDASTYNQHALRIAGGDWLDGSTAFFQDPLYPYFLAALYRLFGHDLLPVRLVQVGFAVVTCLLVGLVARQLAGPVWGNLAALAWAHFKPDVFNTSELDKTALGLMLTMGALALALRPSLAARAGAGLLFGLVALVRGNVLLVVPVVALLYLLEERGPLRARLRSPGGRSAAAFLACFALVLAPVTARNRVVSGEWILTTSGAGSVLYLGNHLGNHFGAYDAPPFVRGEAVFEELDFRLEAERRVGHPLTARQASAYWWDEALRVMAGSPARTLYRFGLKLWLVVNDFEVGDTIGLEEVARYSPVLRSPLPGVGWFVPLAVLGALVSWRKPGVKVLLAFVAMLWVSIALFFVLARYRVFLVPALAVLSALGGAWLVEAARARKVKAVLGAGALLVMVGVVVFIPPPAARLSPAIGPLNVARVFMLAGDHAEAERLLREAHAVAPTQPGALCGLAELEFETRRLAQAREHLSACLAADQRYRGAWLLLGRLEEAEGHDEAAVSALRKALEQVPGEAEAAEGLRRLGR